MSPSLARLEVVAGRAVGMSVLLDDELLIGRHADGAGRLADDDEISRSHARISLDRSGFCAIEDLGSTNGTFVNGLRIAGPQTLSVGDTIEVGGTTLVVRELPIPASERSLRAVPPQPTVTPGSPAAASVPQGQETPAVGPASRPGSGRPERAAKPPVPPAAARPAGTPTEPSPAPRADAGPPQRPGPPEGAGPADGPGPAGSVSLKLEVDFGARKATISLDDGSKPLKLEFDGQDWRPASSS
jgi:pSer/pThr/pTyr-binding forkhead associated (FHA) protein